MNSKKIRDFLNSPDNSYVLDFSELQKNRPSLAIRRLAALALTRALLIDKGFLSPEQAKTVEIHRKKSGEPFLFSSENIDHLLPTISISHSGPWIACLLSPKETPSFIDMEDMTLLRPYKKLSAYAFSEEENQLVLQTGALGFYKLWTAKEAIAKCNGKGLTYALNIDLGLQLSSSTPSPQTIVKVVETHYHLFQNIKKGTLFITIAQKQP